jgi:uncharacterized membrane protein YccC
MLCALLTGAVWVGSGWKDSELMLLVCGVFLSLFAMSEGAPRIMRHILYGAAGGLAVAASWWLYLDPILAPDAGWTLLCVAPILLVGSLVYVQKRWVFIGLAFNMIFLLASAPTLRNPSGSLLTMSIFILGGIAIAEAFYLWPLGSSPIHEKAALRVAVERQTTKLAAGLPSARARYHRARLRQIILLLIEHEGGSTATEAAFAALMRAKA